MWDCLVKDLMQIQTFLLFLSLNSMTQKMFWEKEETRSRARDCLLALHLGSHLVHGKPIAVLGIETYSHIQSTLTPVLLYLCLPTNRPLFNWGIKIGQKQAKWECMFHFCEAQFQSFLILGHLVTFTMNQNSGLSAVFWVMVKHATSSHFPVLRMIRRNYS